MQKHESMVLNQESKGYISLYPSTETAICILKFQYQEFQ